MKNARPQRVGTSANDQGHSTVGNLPKRINTVTAGVLAELLEGHAITGMDAVFRQCTTRAAAVILYLKSEYGWTFEHRDIATGTTDGRVAWVRAYWLSNATRAAAFADGARDWIDEVRAAAVKRRKGARDARTKAAKLNALRADPRQHDFFEGRA
jgi:hypothetical protein